MLLTPITADAQHSGTTFFSKYAAALDIALRVGDVVIVIVAASLCHALRFGSFGLDAPYDVAALRAAILALAVFPAFGLYRSWRGESVWTEIARASLAWLAVVALLMASEWVVKSAGEFSRLWIGGWFVATIVLLGAHRWVARRMLGALRATGSFAGPAVMNCHNSSTWSKSNFPSLDRAPSAPCLYQSSSGKYLAICTSIWSRRVLRAGRRYTGGVVTRISTSESSKTRTTSSIGRLGWMSRSSCAHRWCC